MWLVLMHDISVACAYLPLCVRVIEGLGLGLFICLFSLQSPGEFSVFRNFHFFPTDAPQAIAIAFGYPLVKFCILESLLIYFG